MGAQLCELATAEQIIIGLCRDMQGSAGFMFYNVFSGGHKILANVV